MIKPRATKPRIYLKARKAITGKRAKPSELGYKRNPKTGKLTKPGTRAFNEKVAFTGQNRDSLLKVYEKKIKSLEKTVGANKKEQMKIDLDKKIYEQKITDLKLKYKRKISDLETQRTHDLEVAERRRLTAIKKRQMESWTKKLNTVLKASRKGTVKEIMDTKFKDLFSQEIDIINKIAIYSKAEAKHAYESIYQTYVEDFNSVFHKGFKPTELKKMSADNIVDFLSEVSKVAKQKNATMYYSFRKRFVK